MCRRNVYEIYEGDELIVRGTHMDFYDKFQIGDWALKTHSANHTLFKRRYTVICVGKEEKKEKPKPIEEKFDHIIWHLDHDKNVLVSEKEYRDNIERLKEKYGEIKERKILNWDGEEKKQKKKTYCYILEVGK